MTATVYELTDRGEGARLISLAAPGSPAAWIIRGRGYTISEQLAHQASQFGFSARPVRHIPLEYSEHVERLRVARGNLTN